MAPDLSKVMSRVPRFDRTPKVTVYSTESQSIWLASRAGQALTTLDTRRGLRRLHSLADSVCIQGVQGRVNDLRRFSPSLIEPRKFQIGWLLEDRIVKPKLSEIKCCKHTRLQKHHPQTSRLQLLLSCLRVFENVSLCNFWIRELAQNFERECLYYQRFWSKITANRTTGIYVNLSPSRQGRPTDRDDNNLARVFYLF